MLQAYFHVIHMSTPALEAESRQNEPMLNRHERISVNPAVCHGRACVRGTRVLVSVIVHNVAAGVPREEILRSYPALTDPDVDAALALDILR